MIRQVNLFKYITTYLKDRRTIQSSNQQGGFDKYALIIKTDAIGDFIIFREYIKVILTYYKQQNIKTILIGNEIWENIYFRNETTKFDEALFLNTTKFLSDRIYRDEQLSKIASRKYEFCVELTSARNILIGEPIVKYISSKHKIGIATQQINLMPWTKWYLDKSYSKLISIPEALIFEGDRIKFFIEKITGISYDITFDRDTNNSEKIIAIFPTSGSFYRTWPMENFIKTTEKLNELGFDAINVFVSSRDYDEFNKHLWKYANLVKLSQPGDMIDAINKSNIIVCHDSAPVHISLFAGKKTICISNGNHYKRFIPYPERFNLKVKYVFPDTFEILTESQRVEKTKIASSFNIKEITTNKVIEQIIELNNE